MTTVIHLSTDELVKAINDEYGVILASERNKLPKAIAIGEKLTALRPRIAPKRPPLANANVPPLAPQSLEIVEWLTP